jgi:pSer/pThr/pTyr-binding forkhead associated (FHA) protein
MQAIIIKINHRKVIMNDDDKKIVNDEALPTQTLNTDSLIPDNRVSVTNELIIVSFYLPERTDPIIVNGARTITIGRRDPKRRINPSIDLTEDDGAKHGVSRMHAEMNLSEGQYHIKDIGSSNGTWVNETKLEPYQPHPVQSGDQIRVGQMAIVIHITLPQRATSDNVATLIEENINKHYTYQFTENTGESLVTNGGLTPSGLQSISTYLEQVSLIYTIVRQAQQEVANRFQITAIHIQTDVSAPVVEVGEGADVMNFLAKKLPNFINSQKDKQASATPQRYSEPMQQIADYALQEIVFKFLDEEIRENYVRSLATYFTVLLSTNLVIEKIDN